MPRSVKPGLSRDTEHCMNASRQIRIEADLIRVRRESKSILRRRNRFDDIGQLSVLCRADQVSRSSTPRCGFDATSFIRREQRLISSFNDLYSDQFEADELTETRQGLVLKPLQEFEMKWSQNEVTDVAVN